MSTVRLSVLAGGGRSHGGEGQRGSGWIFWQQPTRRHKCLTGATEVAQFLAIRSREATKLNETL